MRWLLAACYPLLAHLALMRRDPVLEWAALVSLFAAFFYAGLKRGAGFEWLAFLGLAGASAVVMAVDAQGYALYLPPLVFPSLALLSFAGSLRSGQVPLVTRIARAAHHGALPAALLPYTRRVTWIWTGVLCFVLGVDALLLVRGSREVWSLWANFYGYIFVGAVFVVEYLYRRLRLPGLNPPGGLLGHIRTVTQTRGGAD